MRNQAQELDRPGPVLRNWCSWFGRHEDGHARPQRVLPIALHHYARCPPTRTPHARGRGRVSAFGRRGPPRTAAWKSSGAASSGPIRQRMRQFTAPSVSTGTASICSQWTTFMAVSIRDEVSAVGVAVQLPLQRIVPSPFYRLYHNRPRRKNPEATTPSAVSASAKEAQTVVDPEVVTAHGPKAARDTAPSITRFDFLSIGRGTAGVTSTGMVALSRRAVAGGCDAVSPPYRRLPRPHGYRRRH